MRRLFDNLVARPSNGMENTRPISKSARFISVFLPRGLAQDRIALPAGGRAAMLTLCILERGTALRDTSHHPMSNSLSAGSMR